MKTGYLVLTTLVLLLIGGCMLHTRSDSVHVTEIEGMYRIRFISTGKYLSPLTPEGPFPPWSDASTFQTNGEGEADARGGIVFVLGKNMESQYGKYDEGRLVIRDGAREILLDAQLSQKYKDSTDHSGTYRCTMARPVIQSIERFPDQQSMMNCYVRAMGQFSDFKFISGPYVFADRHVDFVAGSGKHRGPGRDYAVIGLVQKNPAGDGYEIRVFSAVPIK